MTRQEFIADYLPLYEPLYRVAYYILEDAQDAEDAVQDLFVKVWNSRESFTTANPKAYCMTMMKNLCIDRIRKGHNVHLEPLSDRLSGSEDIVRANESREILNRVLKTMDSLSESQRKVLEMRVFEDLSYEEMSKLTGMNKLSLRVLLSQARRKLRDEL